ncbi:MAG: STM3941 family protein [Bacteroidota bacterium]
MEPIAIRRSRTKTFLALLGAIAFVVLGVGMVILPDTIIVEKIIGGAAVLFFGSTIPIGIKKVSNTIALELSQSHLIIEPKTKGQTYRIPWTQITDFREIKIKGTKIVLIYVKNPDEWIAKESNFVKQKVMKVSLKTYGTPFSVASSGLTISSDQFLKLLSQFHMAA